MLNLSKYVPSFGFKPRASGFKSTNLVLKPSFFSTTASGSTLKDKIHSANAEALKRMSNSHLVLEDIAPAVEVMDYFKHHKDTPSLLHAGPPITWDKMCEAMKGAIVGMCMFEGWAHTQEEATKLMESGKVRVAPNNEHNSVGPMSGIITPSMPVFVVKNCNYGNYSFSRPADLHQQFGNFRNIQAVKEWSEVVAPNLSKGIAALDQPLELLPLIQASLEMGDELHNRVNAFTTLLVNQITFGMIHAGISKEQLEATLKFCFINPNGARLTLGLAMACAQAILNPAVGIEYSTILTCMARNGVEWGIRNSATGNQWYTAEAPTCFKYFIFPPYTREDFGNDMGDSVITETAGWGGLIVANSLALAHAVGASPHDAFEISAHNQKMVAGENHQLKIPAFAYAPAPLGIDLRRIIQNKSAPIINTGIAHKESGHSVVARGLLNPPFDCFDDAFDHYCEKYNVTRDEVLATLDDDPFTTQASHIAEAARKAIETATSGEEWSPTAHFGFLHARLNDCFDGLDSAQRLPWKPFVVPNIDFVPLYKVEGGASASLLRFHPGAKVPGHWHTGYEHALVLEGTFTDERGSYSKGDLMINPPGSQHVGIESPEGCTVLMVWEKPVCFLHKH